MGSVEALKVQSGIKKPRTINEVLEAYRPRIAAALPKHLTAERMLRIAVNACHNNPKLLSCDPQTIVTAVMLASQLGLEPGVMGQCYLIPYKQVCTFIPGWQGLLELVNRAGKGTAWTGAVYRGDDFDWCLGDSPYLRHKPCGEEEELLCTYAIARTPVSQFPIIEVWKADKIWKHRDKFNKVGDQHYSFRNPEMYARKVPLLQVIKYIPKSVELQVAMQADIDSSEGTQKKMQIEDVKGIIEGAVVSTSEGEDFAPDQLMSKCEKHGLYPDGQNCPGCEKENQEL